ncbi:arylesterase [Sphingomonas sp. NBWT7]|uniref:arylesterase n=1 Tax=Sphingomonas sp. NBWT7 TaxID=2596913 RepID=UPI0035BB9FF8
MVMRHLVAALALVHLSAACSPTRDDRAGIDNAAAPAAAPANVVQAAAPQGDRRLIVAFGDSLYAGYNLPAGDGFAPVLERALTAQGVSAQVMNAGVSGDTSAGGRSRLGFVLDGLPRKPDLVVLGLGANDMLRGLDPAATRTNLDAMLATLKTRGIPAMLTGMIAAPNMGADYAGAFNAIYPDLAKKYGVPLYPFFLDGVITDRNLLLGDGIHPNAAGVKRVVAKVAPIVADALPPTAGQ